MIIIEGKKDEVEKRLNQRFQYDGPFIKRILEVDPTGYKYVDYIAKKLEKIIPELAGANGGLNVQQGEALQDLFGTIIPWFHANVNRIKEDDIWNAETDFRNQYGMVPNIEGIARSPKDINQYENPQFIKKLMTTIDSRKTEREIEREIKTQADRLYEDDDVLVIRPKSHSASCYYGANTRWCTTQKGHSGYFDKYFREGKLYYFLNKKTGLKLALFKNEKDRDIDVFDATDNRVSLDVLRDSFPNQEELIDELSGVGDFIKSIREFTRGKIDNRDFENSDDLILEVIPNDPLGQSKVVFDLQDDENFFKLLDISEDDVWFYNAINSHYSDYEFIDSYTVDEDFKEGYIVFGDLDDENREKLQKISELLLPQMKFDLNSDEFRQSLASVLLDTFERETDNILSEYFVEKNREMSITARESIDKELENLMETIGFKFKRKHDEIYTTPANLIMWSTRLGLNKSSAMSLIKTLIETYGPNVGGWAEDQYEYQDYDNFDSKSFNDYSGRQLDTILEKIEEMFGEEKMQDFFKLRNKILKKFELGKWYELPKDEKNKFKIKGFDLETNTINVEIQTPSGFTYRKLDLDNFNNLLYQPELF